MNGCDSLSWFESLPVPLSLDLSLPPDPATVPPLSLSPWMTPFRFLSLRWSLSLSLPLSLPPSLSLELSLWPWKIQVMVIWEYTEKKINAWLAAISNLFSLIESLSRSPPSPYLSPLPLLALPLPLTPVATSTLINLPSTSCPTIKVVKKINKSKCACLPVSELHSVVIYLAGLFNTKNRIELHWNRTQCNKIQIIVMPN